MDFLFPLLLSGGILYSFLQRSRLLGSWQEAAATCGLKVVECSVWRRKITACAESVEVKIGASGDDQGESVRIIVSISGPPGFSNMTIRRKPLLRRTQEIKTGDSSFDDTFLLEGRMPQVLALLDSKTRRLLAEVNTKGRLELSASDLRVDNLSGDMVPYVLRLLLDIGQRFTQTTDGASLGQLSLAVTEAGQLSLAQAKAGQLSLAHSETGQLSLAVDPERPPTTREAPAGRPV